MTLALAPAAQAVFEAERQRYFPPALNYIPAHVSLFHHLPGGELSGIRERLRECAAATPGFAVSIEGPMLLGRGVAWRLRSDALQRLRATLAAGWADWLTAQDRQGYRPHLTIQNKVAPEIARALYADKLRDFTPATVPAIGLLLWHYQGGPWDAAGMFPFQPDEAADKQ